MIVDPVSVEPKLQTYIKAAKKQQRYVNTFTPVYCSDTIYIVITTMNMLV